LIAHIIEVKFVYKNTCMVLMNETIMKLFLCVQ